MGDKGKSKDIDANAVQERLNSWLSKTQSYLNEVTSPLVKTGKLDLKIDFESHDMEEIFMAERTIHSKTPNGHLSWAAIISIEQFSRMNGLTGRKMQNIFKELVPEHIYNDARNLVEYCCFRFLSRDASYFHPWLKEPAFQRLIFITMLAWENPYSEGNDSHSGLSQKASFQRKLVGEEAFARLAPAISGVADHPTVHNLFKALAGDEGGISSSTWLTYINELLKVHEGFTSYPIQECSQTIGERVLCISSGSKHPVLRWKNNIAWPGKLVLTDKALYFEAVGLFGKKKPTRLDLTRENLTVEKTKVGPLGSALFDSAISVSSGPESDKLELEFVNFGGEMRRDVWQAFINEVIASHKFIREYGPEDGDPSVLNVYGANKGKERAISSAINGIARLQAVQAMRKLADNPIKLVQFSHLQNIPMGDVLSQALAVNYWGGALVSKIQDASSSDEITESSNHIFDIDGSIFLRKWMKSPSWASIASNNFWKNSSVGQGLVLSKNLVVADASLVERASMACKDRFQVIETTQATIDAAMIEGIPSNVDLFKELLFPLKVVFNNFEKLRHWEEPHLTVSFLAVAYTIILRNLISYVIPSMLMALAASMLLLKGLREQGRLGRSFGKVTIHDEPPSNTIQKIITLKNALTDLENILQKANIALLKLRTIVLSGQPQITNEVALVLLSAATILLVVPFKYILSFVIFDFFTRELDFRKEMVRRFMNFLKEWWATVPATQVVVLPYECECDPAESADQSERESDSKRKSERN